MLNDLIKDYELKTETIKFSIKSLKEAQPGNHLRKLTSFYTIF